MDQAPFVVQEVKWYQFRTPDGTPFLVMVASLPNGFFTAVPCRIPMTLASHGNMALGNSVEAALDELQKALAGKSVEEIFGSE